MSRNVSAAAERSEGSGSDSTRTSRTRGSLIFNNASAASTRTAACMSFRARSKGNTARVSPTSPSARAASSRAIGFASSSKETNLSIPSVLSILRRARLAATCVEASPSIRSCSHGGRFAPTLGGKGDASGGLTSDARIRGSTASVPSFRASSNLPLATACQARSAGSVGSHPSRSSMSEALKRIMRSE